MPDQKKYTLCGGIFLVLLLQARKQRTAARKNAAGEKDGLSDSELFENLIRVAFPDFVTPSGRSFKTYTSSYKSCKLSANEYLPFSNTELADNFDQIIISNYDEALKKMCDFTTSFIDENNMGNWLVRAILEVIHSDESIIEELFYIESGGQPYDKKHLLMAEEIALQPFLLGVWHFIIKYRTDNTVGAETFNSWHGQPASTRAKREFISSVGKNWSKGLQVSLVTISDECESDEQDNFNDDFTPADDMDILALPDGIAPELTGDGVPWLLIPKGILPSNDDYSEYLHNAYAKYNKMKTLLYSDAPREFYKFYVCNDISQKIFIKRYTYRTVTIHDATAGTLKDCSNFILISGTGGLGKSMMMRHLLLDAIDSYEDSGQIPIFIPLKDYDDSYASLLDYVYEKFESLGGCDDTDDFIELLSEGSCLLLFDGLDEIKSDYRKKFEHDLDSFADKYSENMFVISSRPTGSFVSLHRFTVLDLCPFTKEQGVKLIDNLDFRTDEPSIKEKFKTELENILFITHREFTQNPLLLTIMLMTYEQFAEIPSKMHIFYHEAYIALSQKHDASKGAFKRVLKTGLTADRFADYFAEFCARSYRDEKFEFTDILFDKYFNALHERSRGSVAASASNFRDDLVENMCLMFYESGKYHFTHRSFQEYFCALYFSKQKDKTLKPIGDFFEKKQTRATDKTFSMLYDMIPDKIDEYVFEPFLKTLFEECDKSNGYWTFLEKMYPVLYYEEGETDGFTFNDPQSFLYGFIIHKQSINACLSNDDLSLDERFITNEWVYLDENYQNPDIDTDRLIELNEVPSEYTREFGEPEVVGRNYEIEIDKLLSDSQHYKDIIECLESDDFPLMAEFKEAREYFSRLLDSHCIPSDDLFDLFQ